MDNPFENITAQLTAAREGKGLLGRPDYSENRFAIQDALDEAFIAKQAQQIVNDPTLLRKFLEENNIVSESGADAASSEGRGTGLSIGVGATTDTIKQDAFVAGLFGLLTGGIPGALQGGVKSYITDTLAVLDQVNNTRDPIQALNALQGWTDTRTPAPVVTANELNAYADAAKAAGISYDSSAYGGGGGFTNSEGNAPGATSGEVGDASFAGEVGYDQ